VMLVDIGTTADQLGISREQVAGTVIREAVVFRPLQVCLEPWSSASQSG
jgi:hypothetical protein